MGLETRSKIVNSYCVFTTTLKWMKIMYKINVYLFLQSKNKKRNKMVPLDNKVLGFNVVASERINVGELDLGE